MPWNRVVGQDRVVDVLRRAVAGERVAQAYLFHGPEGTGKRVAAMMLAQALECERRQPGDGDACGECNPCRKVERVVHPDVQMHLAVPSTHQRSSDKKEPTKAAHDDIAARLHLLAEEPYAEISYRRRPDLEDPEKASNLQAFYAVERMRDIMKELRYTPVEGKHRISIFIDADTMRKEAANAFLKSLEEPTLQTTIILTTTRVDALLPTIISRCQRLRFEMLGAEEIEQALVERGVAHGTQAALVARMADGSLTGALELARSPELAARRELVLQFFRNAYSGDILQQEEVITALNRLGREPLVGVLHLMMSWVRDLVLAQTLGEDAPLINVDQRDAINRFVGNLPHARLGDMAAVIEHAMNLVRSNVSQQLILIVLSDALRDAMRGRDRPALFAPLAG